MVVGVLAAFGVSNGALMPREEAARFELVRRWESAFGWVDVVRNRKNDSLAVQQNLHYRHGSTGNATREYREGRLPLLLHSRPSDVAFLGLGTGLTAAPAVVDDDVKSAVIVELIPEVVEAARMLAEANLGVVDHPKVEMEVNDGRQYLLRTDRQFDVIVADLFVPWESRAGYLYTVEFYSAVHRRLKADGLFCQWLALYQVGPDDFELIANSFASVFPQTSLWWCDLDTKYPIVAMVGSEQPIHVDVPELERRLVAHRNLPGRTDRTLNTPSDLCELYIGDWQRDPERRLNNDEHPWLEFTAPVSNRSRRALRGSVLEDYYDRVLGRLELRGGQFANVGKADDDRRRAKQRFSLFGDVGSPDEGTQVSPALGQ